MVSQLFEFEFYLNKSKVNYACAEWLSLHRSLIGMFKRITAAVSLDERRSQTRHATILVLEPDPLKIGRRVWERLGSKCTERNVWNL